MTKRIICCVLALALLLAVPALAAGSNGLRTSEAGISFIKEHEGFSATAYEDSVGWAIGYGTHCDVSAYPNGITEAEADALLRQHLRETESYIDSAMAGIGVTLSQNQYDALASLTYNIGVGWLHSGYRLYNMLAAGIQYYTEEYIVNTFARYSNTQGQDTVEALVQRRFEEALIFVYGDYGTGGTPLYEFEYRELEDGDYELYHRVWGQYSPGLYSDVPYTQWYYRYVSPLSAAGIFDGYEDGSFRPWAVRSRSASARTGPAATSTTPSATGSWSRRTSPSWTGRSAAWPSPGSPHGRSASNRTPASTSRTPRTPGSARSTRPASWRAATPATSSSTSPRTT